MNRRATRGIALALASLLGFAVPRIEAAPADSSSASTALGRQAAARLVEAHGGMGPWDEAASVAFIEHWVYTPKSKDLKAKVVVEKSTLRAALRILDHDAYGAWDGHQAWCVDWDLAVPPRFLAHLNYVLIHLPWLANEPGTILGATGTKRLWNGKTYQTLGIALSELKGRHALDVQLLLIDPKTHRLAGCQYTVTYAGVLPPSLDHSPLLTLLIEDTEKEDDLIVPDEYTVYNPDRTRLVTCEIESWSLRDSFDASKVAMPPDAVLDTSPPTRD